MHSQAESVWTYLMDRRALDLAHTLHQLQETLRRPACNMPIFSITDTQHVQCCHLETCLKVCHRFPITSNLRSVSGALQSIQVQDFLASSH